MFPKFQTKKTEIIIPPAKVAKPAKLEDCFQKYLATEDTCRHSAGAVKTDDLDRMEDKYFTLLARWWTVDDDPSIPMDEVRRMLCQLDELYQALHRQGRKVPVRLPLERNRGEPEA